MEVFFETIFQYNYDYGTFYTSKQSSITCLISLEWTFQNFLILNLIWQAQNIVLSKMSLTKWCMLDKISSLVKKEKM
jgi:hypothetical protein